MWETKCANIVKNTLTGENVRNSVPTVLIKRNCLHIIFLDDMPWVTFDLWPFGVPPLFSWWVTLEIFYFYQWTIHFTWTKWNSPLFLYIIIFKWPPLNYKEATEICQVFCTFQQYISYRTWKPTLATMSWIFVYSWNHGTIIQTEITPKKVPFTYATQFAGGVLL